MYYLMRQGTFEESCIFFHILFFEICLSPAAKNEKEMFYKILPSKLHISHEIKTKIDAVSIPI